MYFLRPFTYPISNNTSAMPRDCQYRKKEENECGGGEETAFSWILDCPPANKKNWAKQMVHHSMYIVRCTLSVATMSHNRGSGGTQS